MRRLRVVGLGGGIGAARLWRAVDQHRPDVAMTVVVNTADDLWVHGVRVCPDIDTVMYSLSGRSDVERGWGVRDESWRCMTALRELGDPAWFNLGDVDLATHLFRTGRLRQGQSLSAVTRSLADALGVRPTVLPATDDEIETIVSTATGERMHYEEYLVRHRAQPEPTAVDTVGVDAARPAPGVLDAIAAADLIVIGPSNPIASVLPILGLTGVRQAIAASAAPVVAVTPIVENREIGDEGEARRAISRQALLRARGLPANAAGVALAYRGLCGRFVLDEADAARSAEIEALGLDVDLVPTLLHVDAAPEPLLRAVLGPARAMAAPYSPAGRAR